VNKGFSIAVQHEVEKLSFFFADRSRMFDHFRLLGFANSKLQVSSQLEGLFSPRAV